MATWPFTHNWASTYDVTISFLTTVLTSQSGREQRVAERSEPRRTISTTVLEDRRSAQAFDRFLWTQQASLFDHLDPVTGYTSSVRLDAQQTVTHPSANIVVSTAVLSVDPGSDVYGMAALGYVNRDYADHAYVEDSQSQSIPYVSPRYVDAGYISDEYVPNTRSQFLVATPPDDALYTLAGRQVFPFPVNWSAGRADTLSLPRRTADFGRGVVAVTRPVSFATRAGSLLLLRVGQDETNTLTGFFTAMGGRQGDFWSESLLDDMDIVEIVSTTVKVAGSDAAALFAADTVNSAVALRSPSGGVYRRRVLSAQASGDTTFLQLENDIPEQPARWNRCSWTQVSRFASDDLTIQWTTNTVAQAQVQVQSLPYAAVEAPLADNTITEYYGPLLFPFVDLLNQVVNVETPLTGDYPPN